MDFHNEKTSTTKDIRKIEKKRIIEYAPFLDNKTVPPTTEYKEKIYKKIGDITDHILITDRRGFRGLESKNVVVLLDPKDHQGRQYINESLSRCISNNLYFVCTLKEAANVITKGLRAFKNFLWEGKQTLEDVVEQWKQNGNVDFETIQLTEKEFLSYNELVKNEPNKLKTETAEVDDSHIANWS